MKTKQNKKNPKQKKKTTKQTKIIFFKKTDNMNTIKCAIKPANVDSFLMNIATKSISREKKLI